MLGVPFIFVFFYGMISESIPIFGSTKKYYILILSCLQLAACSLVVTSTPSPQNIAVIQSYLFINSLAMAWTDVLVDGLLVIQQRRDPKHGS